MKKPNRRSNARGEARKRHEQRVEKGGRPRGWFRWLGREVDAFLSLPEWLSGVIVLLVAGSLLAVWRLLSG